jgi:hypothetical protein
MSMRVVFVAYLLLIWLGLGYFLLLGLVHK